MGDFKTQLRFFTIPEWQKEERYLRKQHQNGWEFIFVSGICFYHFKKCEPKDVIYQLDYNPDSVTRKEEYIQLFEDCGWEYLQNFAGYSYFRKAASEMGDTEEEIFCDDASRLDMMKRVYKQRVIPLICIFFCIIIPQIFVQSHMERSENYFLTVIFCILFVLYLVLFLAFGIRFWKYYRSVHR